MKIKSWLMVLICFVLVVQCDSPHFYQEQVATQNNWNKDAAVTFNFEVKDSIGKYDFYLLSRNNNEYPYSNLYLFTKLTTPKGETFTDTLQYYLAFQDGEWVGKGNSLKELYLLYRENVSLKDTGNYQLSVWHGMREENLSGIEDISLIVDKK
ncbi:gliding motility lipoprotein GldH [Moheibacter lacus]|uniref:Gliding motility lipoprotein GldH n=1 Tax=Moheibacter lacus TaxID=2745851 RepID=A0A838ZL56_9FLAO|nr:gliding motility lipoprotein GldH [Moheibacter lacus]MBA5629174.1 gliding motility lipoprotein GldH [Moheibacter lacus]